MCGIVGKLNFDRSRPVSPALLRTMLRAIRHRGPDDEAVYLAPAFGLGHCRLAIIDLLSGRQPLCSEDGGVWLAFNGEIYNYRELRRRLLAHGHVFRSQSDSEVIVHLYQEMGEQCVDELHGMFAFALWDEHQRLLLLARDRVGIKPLYYWLDNQFLIFASEIKAILADPEVTLQLLPATIGRFLTFGYLPGEETLLRNLRKLPPASCLVIKDGKSQLRRYWDLTFQPQPRPLRIAETELLALLEETVRLHLISDVPVGFLLSGGLDSSSLLALAAATGRPLRSYTVGFSAGDVPDERPYAALAARACGTQHDEITITARDFQDFLPCYVWHMEEPVCEPPAVALYYISRRAAQSVKVLLSGEGGDEAFAGYTNYRNTLWLETLKSSFPRLSTLLGRAALLGNSLLHFPQIARSAPLLNLPFDSYYYTRTSTPFSYFNAFAGRFCSPEFAREMATEDLLEPLTRWRKHAPADLLNRMLYLDLHTWLPDDLLLKADKMTMANSVELRVPFLDHRLLEFAAGLPLACKIHGRTTKYILRRALRPRLPAPLLRRAKAGFPVPYAYWLRRDLHAWLADVLLSSQAMTRDYLQRNSLQLLLAENARSGRFSRELFSVVVLELWHQQFLRNPAERRREPAPARARPAAA